MRQPEPFRSTLAALALWAASGVASLALPRIQQMRRHLRTTPRLAAVLAGLALLAAPAAAPAAKKLRDLAERRDLFIGTAAGVWSVDTRTMEAVTPLRDDPTYRKILAGEFNALTPGFATMWVTLRPSRDSYDFSLADELIDFAEANAMMVRGHPLVWHENLPDWLTQGSWTKAELAAILEEHIRTVVAHFGGRVRYWDVVNEPIVCTGPNGDCDAKGRTTLRKTIWRKALGKRYIEKAFRWAHEADPDARLIYNETWHEGFPDGNFLKARQDATYKLVKKGVPIHGVGFQTHMIHGIDWGQDPASVAANMLRYADLGLEVQVTEMDVRIEEPASKQDLKEQANVFRDMLEVCLAASNCTLFQMWGFTDRFSWIPLVFEGYGSATIFDENYRKKPAYKKLKNALK